LFSLKITSAKLLLIVVLMLDISTSSKSHKIRVKMSTSNSGPEKDLITIESLILNQSESSSNPLLLPTPITDSSVLSDMLIKSTISSKENSTHSSSATLLMLPQPPSISESSRSMSDQSSHLPKPPPEC